MSKKQPFFIVIQILVLFFCFHNSSFATENTDLANVYPDYSCEFCGKDNCEKFNRKLFVFNLKLNKYVLRPINIVWASIMPKYGMDRFQNLYNNINYPTRLAGCLLQKDFKASKQETLRFITNTTIGFGGLFDPAKNRFNLEPRQEDIPQVLAYYKIKPGPYLVLPVVQGNLRDLFGKLLNCPLRPTSYAGPFGAAANAIFTINNTTYAQPWIKKVDESYADPYEFAKQIDGISKYIKVTNLDRKEIFEEKTASQNITKISTLIKTPNITSDVNLNNYNPQGAIIDSLRTAMFDNQKTNSSIWSEMSVWNRNFSKKLKTASISITSNQKKYKYRYILQKDKKSPLAVIYPSIGEGIMNDKSTILAKILYEQGYSVIIQGSAFNWEFIKSMPKDYRPGIPAEDAKYLRKTTAKIINNIQSKKGYIFDEKIIVGCSFGALTGLFVTAQNGDNSLKEEDFLEISNCIAINPPIEILFAMKQIDNYSQEWKNNPEDLKFKTALTAEKILHISNSICQKEIKDMPEKLPFTDEEAKLIIGFIMKQKLYDVVFAIEDYSRNKKTDLNKTINKMSFYDYAQKYLLVSDINTSPQFNYETSLYSLKDFLITSKNYKIYHSSDDYFINQQQLAWLKNITNNNSIIFSNGSHLGFLYRPEFLIQFLKDIKRKNLTEENRIKI